MEKTVLITGGSRGIGAAAARQFGAAGWNVALNYCRSSSQAQLLVEELTALGVRVVALEGDVSDPAQAADLVRRAEEFGPLDALVCCAGIALPQQLLLDTTDEQWRRVMAVDLDGVFYPIRAVYPAFVRRQKGAIVTVSSMWGVTGGSCEVAYSAAKAGVIGLTKALAKELGPSHVRVNCVAPGVVETEMNAHLSAEDLAALGEETPLGRIGTPEETARAIVFLASEQASFITGQVLRVDGGMVI
jgi:3-oxoacyl-[acyl-carrier protein] reductase